MNIGKTFINYGSIRLIYQLVSAKITIIFN